MKIKIIGTLSILIAAFAFAYAAQSASFTTEEQAAAKAEQEKLIAEQKRRAEELKQIPILIKEYIVAVDATSNELYDYIYNLHYLLEDMPNRNYLSEYLLEGLVNRVEKRARKNDVLVREFKNTEKIFSKIVELYQKYTDDMTLLQQLNIYRNQYRELLVYVVEEVSNYGDLQTFQLTTLEFVDEMIDLENSARKELDLSLTGYSSLKIKLIELF